jgi:hypothetical protein
MIHGRLALVDARERALMRRLHAVIVVLAVLVVILAAMLVGRYL